MIPDGLKPNSSLFIHDGLKPNSSLFIHDGLKPNSIPLILKFYQNKKNNLIN